jgi:hypothetical protein
MVGIATTLVSSMNPAIQGAARQAMQAHTEGENGLHAFAESLPGMIFPTLLAVGIGYVTSHVVDKYIFPTDIQADREQMYVEMRELAKKHADGELAISYNDPKSQTKRESPKRTITPAERDMNEMTDLVRASMTKLKEARMDLVKAEGKSKCSYCKATLSELGEKIQQDEDIVKKETEFILSTSEKWSKMQELKSTGKLRSDATWDTMTPKERNLVGGI